MDKLNLKDIISAYEHVFKEKKYLYKPIENSTRLLILLSAHNQKTNYFLLRSFIENQRCNLLFLTDEFNTWYLNEDNGKDYKEIISDVISGYELNNVYIFGSSMAGYGALHFALFFNIHCLCCNPQVNLKLSLDYAWQELSNNIHNTLKNVRNLSLDEIYNSVDYDKVITIVHGHAPIDVANVELILGSSASVRKLLVYTLDTDDHAMPFGRNVDKIYQMLDLMNSFVSALESASFFPKISSSHLKSITSSLDFHYDHSRTC